MSEEKEPKVQEQKAVKATGKKVAIAFWTGKDFKEGDSFVRPDDMTDLCYDNLIASGKIIDA